MADLSRKSDTPAGGDRARLLLARKWAYRLLGTTCVPVAQQDLEGELRTMLDTVCACVHREPFRTEPAREVGARLVELGCTGADSLPCTVDVLGKGLTAQREFQPIDRFAERIALVLGAVACGFAAAIQRVTFDEQEQMQRSLLKAVQDMKGDLKRSEERFDQVATASASGILITEPDGRIVRANGAMAEILGYRASELAETNLFEVVSGEHAAALRDGYQALLAGRRARIKQAHRLLRVDGDAVRVSVTMSVLDDGEGGPNQVVLVVEDDTELLLLQSELNRQAVHDPVTGLPNRQFFGGRLESALRQADSRYGLTLFHLELNAYGVVCDGLGRKAGDQLLVAAGRRLTALFGAEKAVVAQIGDGRFGILVENSADTPEVATLVARINEELAEPIYVDDQGVTALANIGVLHRPEPGADFAEVLRAADLSLRRAKANGPGQWELFHAVPGAQDRKTCLLAAAMPGAWEHGELRVHYQPIASLADGRITDVEATLHWDRPKAGPLDHDRCVELAELTGLVLALGAWELDTAIRQTGWWQQRLAPGLGLAVGLTPSQAADADLVSRVVRILDATGFPSELLTVGMPVRALSGPQARDNLGVLADLGIRPRLDSFGTATAELTLVEDLPVRSVRLAPARSATDSAAGTVLMTVVPLIRSRGATVVVDDVHTAEQAAWWQRTGADSAYLGVSGPPSAMVARLGGQ
ncbi:putative bifunctional diguanylate cyclase/phosphodiesterase [Amycolatopsis anabasis]|uniref:putative bifunctional diguanylate cyclase/phosphodiesterase n=1 Tax=Amycolatopsis anabasis TaxID=1840409 RepID=UPI00131E46AF|nr:EAL domain-containing protein [Amycolatopsis anabasis]